MKWNEHVFAGLLESGLHLVAFAAPLAPFGHCGEAARKRHETRPLAYLEF